MSNPINDATTATETSAHQSEAPQTSPERVSAQKSRLGFQLLATMFVELMLINMMIHTIANDCAAPPASSGNFFMWSLGGICFELAVIPLLLLGFSGDFNRRLILALTLFVAFVGSVIIGLDSTLGAVPVQLFWTLLFLAPLGCVIAGIPVGLLSFLAGFRIQPKTGVVGEAFKPSIKTIMLVITAFAVAITAAQRTLENFVGDKPAFELSGVTDYLGANSIMLIFVSAVVVWILFGLVDGKNFHKHVWLGMVTSIVAAWAVILLVSLKVELEIDLVEVGFYFTISTVSALLHFYFLAIALRLMGYELSGLRQSAG